MKKIWKTLIAGISSLLFMVITVCSVFGLDSINPMTNDKNYTWLIVVGAISLVLIIVLVVVGAKKKK